MNKASKKHCVPCETNVLPPLKGKEITFRLLALPGWKCIDEHHIEKRFIFPDFKSALHFTNATGTIAEEEGHHPDISLSWGYVEIKIFTHSMNGLSENDFILAELIEGIDLNSSK